MRILTQPELSRRSDSELTALFNVFNNALLLAKPMSREWRDAQAAIDNLHRMRAARLKMKFPQPR